MWSNAFVTLSVCLPGSYGKRCAQQCQCPHGTSCNHVTGQCGCPAGLTGSGCERSEWSSLNLIALMCSVKQWLCCALQCASQVRLGWTVIRCASALNSTSSATPSLVSVTVLPDTMPASVRQVCIILFSFIFIIFSLLHLSNINYFF